MCSVYSAVSGEIVATLDDFENKCAKEIKQTLGAEIGVLRFRQRFMSEDGSREIQDDEFLDPAAKVQLLLLEFWPPDSAEDRKMMLASGRNDSLVLEKLLGSPRNPNVGRCTRQNFTAPCCYKRTRRTSAFVA